MSLNAVTDDIQYLVDLAHVYYSLPRTQQLPCDKLLFLRLATHTFVYVLHRFSKLVHVYIPIFARIDVFKKVYDVFNRQSKIHA